MSNKPAAPRISLFWKYFLALFAAVVVPLLFAGSVEAWFGYRDQRTGLNNMLDAEARGAAAKIQDFIEGIRDQLGWAVLLPWPESADEKRRLDAFLVLRQVPAIESLSLVDAAGRERLFLSRIGLNRIESGRDQSGEPAVAGARSHRTWFGPVTFQRGSEPFMTIAVAGNRPSAGVAMAEVNLKLIWDVISAIQVGRTGEAFVLDRPGRLIAHPDISLVLRADEAATKPLRDLRASILTRPGEAIAGRDVTGGKVLAATAPISGVDWSVIVKQPVVEAFGPIYAALWRTIALLIAGAGLAAMLAYWLSRRMVEPIMLLEEGVGRIGAGHFEHRIHLETGDEFERLATRFNEMASELAVSQERSERINRLKRFLAPQVAELVERTGDDHLLDGRRVDVVVAFCDLRGFTAFSARAEPETVIGMLGDYYSALETVVATHGATLTNFSGDGAMVLFNAPVPCDDPALGALEMARDMQIGVHELLASRHSLDHRLGFGVGLAMGPATVGRIGSEGRLDYTAIGNVVNLASRLCSIADDFEVLCDRAAAQSVGSRLPLVALEARVLKGYDRPVAIYSLVVAGKA